MDLEQTWKCEARYNRQLLQATLDFVRMEDNRLPFSAGKEKNARRAGLGAFTALPADAGFLSSATDEPSVQVATVSQPNASPKRGFGGKKKAKLCL